MKDEMIVTAESIGGLIQRTLNHVDTRLMDHGARVAWLVKHMLLVQGKYGEQAQREICFAALMHDIGAYKTEEIDRMVHFETEEVWEHSVYGYLFLKHLTPLEHWAEIVLYHHAGRKVLERLSIKNRDAAQILNLADRVDVYRRICRAGNTALYAFLEQEKKDRIDPEIVALFLKAEDRYQLIRQLDEGQKLLEDLPAPCAALGEGDAYLKTMIYSIDFRSQHTVTHTITTTYIAVTVAGIMGLDQERLRHVYYGAMLHDLGKIAIPVEILEFPGKLSPQAMAVMKTHVDFTEEILGGKINPVTTNIALRHHEKLDGSGYPRGLCGAQLSLEERILAVSDIVSALLGTRSYKDAFSREKTLGIIRAQADEGKLDDTVVHVIEINFDRIMKVVKEQCEPILRIYCGMQEEYLKILDRLQSLSTE